MMTCQQRAGPVVVVPLAGEIDLFNCDQVYERSPPPVPVRKTQIFQTFSDRTGQARAVV